MASLLNHHVVGCKKFTPNWFKGNFCPKKI